MKKRNFKELHLGLRFTVVAIMLFTGNFLAAVLTMFLPTFSIQSLSLGFTEEDTKELNTLMAGVAEKHKAVVKEEIAKAAEGLLSVDKLNSQLEAIGVTKDNIDKINKALEEQGTALTKLLNGGVDPKDNKVITIDKALADNGERLKNIQHGEWVNFKITNPRYAQKAVVTRGAVADTTMGYMVQGIGQMPLYESIISKQFRHVTVGDNSGGIIRYLDVVPGSIVRGAATVAEGGTKPESAISWIEKNIPIGKIADTIPATTEMLADITWVRSELERLLTLNIELKEDEQLYSGNGTPPNLKGVYTTAPAFNAAVYPGPDAELANLYDLIAILRVQIMNAKSGKYNPNRVLMNPVDVLRFKLAKGADGHYVLPPFVNGQNIDTVQVIETARVTANTLVIGDFRYGTIYDREQIEIKVGWVNDQFIKNELTILAEKREALLIRDIDADAFLKVTDIAAAITAITLV